MIDSLQIKNFKCFEDIKIEHIKRFNLFTGKNNMGKSTLLEAIFVANDFKNPNIFANQLIWRSFPAIFSNVNTTSNILELFFYNFKFENKEIEINLLSKLNDKINSEPTKIKILPAQINDESCKLEVIKYDNRNTAKFISKIYYKNTIKNINGFEQLVPELKTEISKNEPTFERFISYINPNKNTIINSFQPFQELVKNNCESKVLEIMKIVEPRLTEITIIGNDIYCNIGLPKKVSLKLLGDGSINFFNTFVHLHNFKPGGILLLDEIDNGIHYSLFVTLIENILKIAQEKNVQIFATTHNKEFIEAYNQVVNQETNDELMSYYQLYFDTDIKRIKAIHNNAELLEFRIDNNLALRGEI